MTPTTRDGIQERIKTDSLKIIDRVHSKSSCKIFKGLLSEFRGDVVVKGVHMLKKCIELTVCMVHERGDLRGATWVLVDGV